MNVGQELERARNNLVRAQNKLEHLLGQGKNSRDEQAKYWKEQAKVWAGYANELNALKYETVALSVTKTRSGAEHIRLEHNGRYLKFLGRDSTPKEVLERLTIADDYRSYDNPCAVCGNPETELHHWAPREFFPETCELWPISYLCKQHHQEWHSRITTPFRKLRRQTK